MIKTSTLSINWIIADPAADGSCQVTEESWGGFEVSRSEEYWGGHRGAYRCRSRADANALVEARRRAIAYLLKRTARKVVHG